MGETESSRAIRSQDPPGGAGWRTARQNNKQSSAAINQYGMRSGANCRSHHHQPANPAVAGISGRLGGHGAGAGYAGVWWSQQWQDIWQTGRTWCRCRVCRGVLVPTDLCTALDSISCCQTYSQTVSCEASHSTAAAMISLNISLTFPLPGRGGAGTAACRRIVALAC